MSEQLSIMYVGGKKMKVRIITFKEYLEKANNNKERYIFPYKYEEIPLNTLGFSDMWSWKEIDFSLDSTIVLHDLLCECVCN